MKDKMVTNYYKVLEALYDNRATINGEEICIVTQVEIAEQLNLSTITINALFKKLRNDGLVRDEAIVGRYKLSDAAIKAVKAIKRIECCF